MPIHSENWAYWHAGACDTASILDAYTTAVDNGLWKRWSRALTQSSYYWARHPKPPASYQDTHADYSQFATAIRSDPSITHVVQVGIGGSSLGPQALHDALRRCVPLSEQRPAAFIANLDSDDFDSVIQTVPVETTLFIVVSKSGGTEETHVNLKRLVDRCGDSVYNRVVTITSPGSPLDQPNRYRRVFYLDKRTGGRFSGTSVVGGLLVSIALGTACWDAVLHGAYAMDQHANRQDPGHNIPLAMALIWYNQRQQSEVQAIIPYTQSLDLFPNHLQQLICESNGKSVTHTGAPVTGPTAPVVFGQTGTLAQHAFFQLLHQGTHPVPVTLIAVRHSQCTNRNQRDLMAHVIAQSAVFQQANRPHTVLLTQQLTPQAMGALWSLYEATTVFQACLWELNAFDQPGVELGKRIAQQVYSPDGELDHYARQLRQFIDS
ncbi:MAG: hypothetical protein CMJ93_07690 [Planctomycetes bacterium]|nr:hypothetical protein [Planctomycetota bacterium]